MKTFIHAYICICIHYYHKLIHVEIATMPSVNFPPKLPKPFLDSIGFRGMLDFLMFFIASVLPLKLDMRYPFVWHIRNCSNQNLVMKKPDRTPRMPSTPRPPESIWNYLRAFETVHFDIGVSLFILKPENGVWLCHLLNFGITLRDQSNQIVYLRAHVNGVRLCRLLNFYNPTKKNETTGL